VSKEDPNSCSHPEGWGHAGDALLFGENAEVICAF
jgi:hypothetical protein